MSIRVVCEKCASVLKIKEELAGTKGKCPKCKTAFVVPQPGEAAAAEDAAAKEKDVAPEATPAAAAAAPAEAKAPPAEKPAAEKPVAKVSAAAAKSPAPPAASDLSDHELKTQKKTDPEADAIPAPAAKAAEKPAAAAAKNGDEFDPFEFLMADGGPKAKPAAAPRPEPPAPKRGGPAPKAGGRRLELSDDETAVPAANSDTAVPNSKPVVRSAAESASAMLTGAATSASARDLLARSAQESRARASQMPNEATAPKTDYAALLKEIGRSFGPYIAGTIVLSIGLYYMMDKMMGARINLPKLAPAYGKVTLGGKPLAGVSVVFTPLTSKDAEVFKGKDNERPRDAMGVTNENGEYEIMYLPEEGIAGAVVGKNRIWIKPESLEDYKRVPPQYQNAATSDKIEEVKPGGLEFNLILN